MPCNISSYSSDKQSFRLQQILFFFFQQNSDPLAGFLVSRDKCLKEQSIKRAAAFLSRSNKWSDNGTRAQEAERKSGGRAPANQQ